MQILNFGLDEGNFFCLSKATISFSSVQFNLYTVYRIHSRQITGN
jgi:hypothetical protein